MNTLVSDSLLALRQHWHLQIERGLPGFDWLGEKVQGDWLVEQVEKERRCLSRLLQQVNPTTPVVIGISLPDGTENLVLGLALSLEGMAQAILPVSASATEQTMLGERYGLTHCIGTVASICLKDWQPIGMSAQGLQCWQKLAPIPISNRELAGLDAKNHQPIMFIGTTSGTTSGHPGLFYRDGQNLLNILIHHWSPFGLINKPLLTPSLQNWSGRIQKLIRLLKGQSFVARHSEVPLAENPIPDDCDGAISAPNAFRRQLARGDLQQCPKGFLIISSSDHFPRELRQRVACIDGIDLGITYATSQTGPLTWLPPEALLEEPDSLGWLLNHVKLQPLVNGEGFERDGLNFREAMITTPSRCLNPGDLLAISNSGQIIFGGRSNDVFLYNSILISPVEIEEIIYSHPGIQECAAFGALSERFGGVPMAAITAKDGWSNQQLTQDLEALCREALGTRRPHRFISMAEIPKGSTGKALRRTFREQYALKQ